MAAGDPLAGGQRRLVETEDIDPAVFAAGKGDGMGDKVYRVGLAAGWNLDVDGIAADGHDQDMERVAGSLGLVNITVAIMIEKFETGLHAHPNPADLVPREAIDERIVVLLDACPIDHIKKTTRRLPRNTRAGRELLFDLLVAQDHMLQCHLAALITERRAIDGGFEFRMLHQIVERAAQHNRKHYRQYSRRKTRND